MTKTISQDRNTIGSFHSL